MKRLRKMGGLGKLAAMFGGGWVARWRPGAGACRRGSAADARRFPGLGGASPFNLPPGFDKFQRNKRNTLKGIEYGSFNSSCARWLQEAPLLPHRRRRQPQHRAMAASSRRSAPTTRCWPRIRPSGSSSTSSAPSIGWLSARSLRTACCASSTPPASRSARRATTRKKGEPGEKAKERAEEREAKAEEPKRPRLPLPLPEEPATEEVPVAAEEAAAEEAVSGRRGSCLPKRPRLPKLHGCRRSREPGRVVA